MSASNVRSSTIGDVLTRSARKTPDRIAVTYDDRKWTYREFDDAVSRTAKYLLDLGLRKGDRVAAYGQNSDAYAILFNACARAGLVHVPVNYALTGGELSFMLEQSGASAIFVDDHLAQYVDELELESVPSIRHSMTSGDGSILAKASSGEVPELDVDVEETDIAQLLYTSGTTSRPKGAIMTHRALVHHYVSCIVALDYSEHDNPLHAMPLYHSAGMHVLLMPYLAVGATNHIMQGPNIPEILRRIEADKIGCVFLAPTVWVPLSQHPDFATRDLSALKKAIYGASIMPVPILQKLQKALPGLGFYNAFGQSEIGPLATVLRPEEHEARPDSCGRPILFVQMRVVDAEMNDVEPGGTGEVVYRSPQLCEGYWDNTEATEEAFRGGWFHSGDLARIDAEGYITVVDRIKDVINTGGVLVASRDVEDVLYTHPAVAEVAVVALPDPKWIEIVSAFVVKKDDVTEEELIEHSRKSLAKFKIPKKVIFVDELPRNGSGKLLKRVLREQATVAETPAS